MNHHSPIDQEFQTNDEFISRDSFSPDFQNRDNKLRNQSYVDLRQSHVDLSVSISNNLRSISADKMSSNDPESIER